MINKKFVNTILFVFLSAGALVNCNNSISGGSTETVNTKIAARVLASDGSAVSGAIVKIIPSDWDPISPEGVVYVSTTDHRGFFSISVHQFDTGMSYYNLLISGLREGIFYDSLLLKAGSDLELEPITIKPTGSIRGIAAFEMGSQDDSVQVILPGSEYSFKIAQGLFSFSGIQNGKYRIRFISPDSTFESYDTLIDVVAGTEVTLKDTVKLSLVRTLIDNFDDGDELLIHNRSDINNGWNSYWYIFNEKDQDSLTKVFPSGVFENLKLLFTGESAYSGKSVHLSAVLADRSNPFMGIGCRLPSNYQHIADLKSLKGLSFYMRGKGTWRVSFIASAINKYPSNERWGTWGKYVQSPTEWEKVTINVSEILPQPGSPQARDSLMWEEVRDSVGILQFVTAGSAKDSFELYLDNIELHGTGLEDLR
ncbi:MAG: hypothetical protein JW863_13480 [Chitinispirillaceae bacterium]|nr:hypothetical protein [Chitinispirillaceae bacterium]